MTAANMRLLFDQLQEKTNAPWFDDTEKDRFLTIAQWKIINEVIKDLEEDKDNLERIKTLVRYDPLAVTAARIPYTVFKDSAGTGTASPVLVLSINDSTTLGKKWKFARHNDINKFNDNTYKAPSSTNPYYTIDSVGYKLWGDFAPATDPVVTYIASPTAVDSLPERMHNKQVAMAMEETGFVTEAQALIMMGEQAAAE
jgi:hypothetical protein